MGKEVKTKTIEYKLLRPITFHKSGEEAEVTLLHLKAPSRKHRKSTRYLKQVFFRAVNEISRNSSSEGDSSSSKEDDGKMDGNSLVVLLMGAESVDISQCLEELRAILTTGAAEIDTGVDLSNFSYQQLSESDEERLLGVYMADFLLSFWMKEMSQK